MPESGQGPTQGAGAEVTGFSPPISVQSSSPSTSSGPMVPVLPDRLRQRVDDGVHGPAAVGAAVSPRGPLPAAAPHEPTWGGRGCRRFATRRREQGELGTLSGQDRKKKINFHRLVTEKRSITVSYIT